MADLVVNAKKKAGEGRSGACGRNCQLCGLMEETTEVMDRKGRRMRLVGKWIAGR